MPIMLYKQQKTDECNVLVYTFQPEKKNLYYSLISSSSFRKYSGCLPQHGPFQQDILQKVKVNQYFYMMTITFENTFIKEKREVALDFHIGKYKEKKTFPNHVL